MATEPILKVIDLQVSYYTDAGRATALAGATLSLNPQEKLGLVGESGSGKSTMALAMMRMIKPPGRIEAGQVIVDGTDLRSLTDEQMLKARLSKIAYIPQGAMNSLNPVIRIGAQMVDAIKAHDPKADKAVVVERCMQSLESVDLKRSVYKMYAHELSGGMKQRVCIAISILLKPKVIICDEPTSALDVVTHGLLGPAYVIFFFVGEVAEGTLRPAAGVELAWHDLARVHQLPLVPDLLAGVAGRPALLFPDLLHPNAAGHERLARNVRPQLELLLAEVQPGRGAGPDAR